MLHPRSWLFRISGDATAGYISAVAAINPAVDRTIGDVRVGVLLAAIVVRDHLTVVVNAALDFGVTRAVATGNGTCEQRKRQYSSPSHRSVILRLT